MSILNSLFVLGVCCPLSQSCLIHLEQKLATLLRWNFSLRSLFWGCGDDRGRMTQMALEKSLKSSLNTDLNFILHFLSFHYQNKYVTFNWITLVPVSSTEVRVFLIVMFGGKFRGLLLMMASIFTLAFWQARTSLFWQGRYLLTSPSMRVMTDVPKTNGTLKAIKSNKHFIMLMDVELTSKCFFHHNFEFK